MEGGAVMRKVAFTVLILSGLVAAQICGAATEDMDEVVVRGTRLTDLKAAIVEAENRFYARYNELNKVEDFDIECVVAPPTGTRVKQRVCRTVFQLNAQGEQAGEFGKLMADNGSYAPDAPGKPRGLLPTTDPEVVFLARYKEYKENVLYLLKMNPDLRRLVHEREEAAKRYDAERMRRFKGRLVLFE